MASMDEAYFEDMEVLVFREARRDRRLCIHCYTPGI